MKALSLILLLSGCKPLGNAIAKINTAQVAYNVVLALLILWLAGIVIIQFRERFSKHREL